MQNTLIDAGPLIALFNKRDRYHQGCKKFLTQFTGGLYTSWPVVGEVTHMLDFHPQVPLDFLRWVQRGALHIIDLNSHHLNRIIELGEKYHDLPMDLADGSLLVLAETMHIKNIVTIDSDYHVYRLKDRSKLHNLLTPFL